MILKQIQFVTEWRKYRPGDIAEFGLGFADGLVNSHRAIWMPVEKAPDEEAPVKITKRKSPKGTKYTKKG